MLGINELKTGTNFTFRSEPYTVLSSDHIKMGRGAGIMRVKMRNLLNGKVLEESFHGSDTVEEADMLKSPAQFLYRDGETLHFMDNTTFEQFELSRERLGRAGEFLKEDEPVMVLRFEGKAVNAEPPIKVTLKVTYTEPAVKGNTVTNTLKPATLETGAEVRVPLFVKAGDVVRIDTRTGAYLERA